MPPVIKELERISMVAPLGVRFRDLCSGALVSDGLRVVVYPETNPDKRTPALVNRSSTYVAHHLPGLRGAESGAGDDAYWASLPPRRRFIVEVVDLDGRFLPFTFPADLPVRGLFEWDCPAPGSPLSPLEVSKAVPLFSAPSRGAVAGMAIVRAELWDPTAGAPAAWAVLTATPEGGPPAQGIADEQGRVVIFLPYPEPIDAIPGASPPSGPPLTEQSWAIDLHVQYVPMPSPPSIPDLCETLWQAPATLWADFGEKLPLTGATLSFGRDVTLRSVDTATDRPLSVVHVTPSSP
jgi:hypothetical protein